MVIYTCTICLKEFNRKSSFIDHTQNKKKPCRQVPPASTNNPPIITNVTPISTNNPPDVQQINLENEIFSSDKEDKIENTIKNKKIIHTCGYCGLGFTRKDALKRHTEGRCKVKTLDNEHKEKTFELLIKENEDIKKRIR